MMLYFDIETFSENGFRSAGTKIISIQYRDFDGNFRMLKEWESSERDILQKFLTDLKMKRSEDPYGVMLVGHNILRFDIPIIIQRMVANGMGSPDELHDFFRNIMTVDTMQCMLPFNSMRFKGLNSADVSKKLGLTEPHHKNTEIESFYKNREFGKIEQHAVADLDFVQDLYWTLKKEDVRKLFSENGVSNGVRA